MNDAVHAVMRDMEEQPARTRAGTGRLLADMRLLGQMTDQDVRRFALDLVGFCADADQRAGGMVTTDEIRDMLRKVADGQ
jgi:hypothetical protein